MATLDTSSVALIIITNIFVGLGVGLGFWLSSRLFIKSIKKQMPQWIKEINDELRKNRVIEHAIQARKKF